MSLGYDWLGPGSSGARARFGPVCWRLAPALSGPGRAIIFAQGRSGSMLRERVICAPGGISGYGELFGQAGAAVRQPTLCRRPCALPPPPPFSSAK